MTGTDPIGPSPPHDEEAEVCVLGSLLLDASTLRGIAGLLSPEDFYRESHRVLFRTIVEDLEDGRGMDAVLLRVKLERLGTLEQVGGSQAIVNVLDRVPTAAHSLHYAQIVRDLARRRRALAAYGRAEAAAREGTEFDGSVEDLRAALDALGAGASGYRPLPFLTGAALAETAGPEVEWLAEGLLAKTVITEMSAPPKVGKTTFAAYAIAAIIDGKTFLGRKTVKSKVIYLTEERRATIRRAFKRAGILGREEVKVLLLGDVGGRSWPDIAAAVTREAIEFGAALVVADTTSRWAGLQGDAENDAGAAAEALKPLEAVASAGLSVLSLRHERKSGGELGQSARGSSAFTGGADIVLRLQKANVQGHPGRRLLEGTGRLEEVPESIVIELGPDGYMDLGDTAEVERKAAREWLLDNLPGPNETPTALQDIRAAYQATAGKDLSRSTLQRALGELQESHQAVKVPRSAGKSGKADGYRLSDVPNYGGAPGQEGTDHGPETAVPSDLPRPLEAGQPDEPLLPRPTPLVGQQGQVAPPEEGE